MRQLALWLGLGSGAVLAAVLASSGCAAKTPPARSSSQASPASQPSPAPRARTEQLRACESCQRQLELCTQNRADARTQDADYPAKCEGDMLACLRAQQLDPVRCAGLK